MGAAGESATAQNSKKHTKPTAKGRQTCSAVLSHESGGRSRPRLVAPFLLRKHLIGQSIRRLYSFVCKALTNQGRHLEIHSGFGNERRPLRVRLSLERAEIQSRKPRYYNRMKPAPQPGSAVTQVVRRPAASPPTLSQSAAPIAEDARPAIPGSDRAAPGDGCLVPDALDDETA